MRLGNGYADLLAVEPSGRPAIIEIKLARSAEARRAVVAQVLAYAAYLHGLETSTLTRDVLGHHLRTRGYDGLADAIAANDQEGSFDADVFAAGLADCLTTGRFRLVFVLDDAPPELTRLIGYLSSMTDKLLIDLITVAAYQVGGSQIIVPQRVEPEYRSAPQAPSPPPALTEPKPESQLVEGAADFEAAIEQAAAEYRPALHRLCDWAVALEREGVVKLSTYHGKAGRLTLLPRMLADAAGLVTIYNERGLAYLQFWRSVFQRRAPQSLLGVEQLVSVGQGNWISLREVSDELLDVLTAAYREAATGRVVT